MTLRFGQKLPLILSVKVIKSQSRSMSHLKMKIFFRPRGVNLTPPSRIGLMVGEGMCHPRDFGCKESNVHKNYSNLSSNAINLQAGSE